MKFMLFHFSAFPKNVKLMVAHINCTVCSRLLVLSFPIPLNETFSRLYWYLFLKVWNKISFYIGAENEKIKVGRGVLTLSILWRPPLLPTPFSNFVQPPLSATFNPTHNAHSVVLFILLNGWSHHIWCATFLNDIIDVQMLSLRTLMRFLCNKASSLLMSDTWCGFSLPLWFDITHANNHKHTQRHITHSGGSRPIYPFKHIFTPTVMCSQHLSLLYWMNNSLISKMYFPQCLFFSKIIHKSHISWLDAIRLG